jgi:hypothetical protein
MMMGEINRPALKASRAVVLLGEVEKWLGYAAWRRVRTSIWESVKSTAFGMLALEAGVGEIKVLD